MPDVSANQIDNKKFIPRWYQDESADAILKAIENKDIHPIAVIPTGAGKTFISSLTIDRYLEKNPDRTIIILSHVAEILEQDYNASIQELDYDIGLYSAMLDSKTIGTITVAGIQSVYKKPELFENVGLIIIDEAHLITDEDTGMYRQFLSNFDCNYVGLTATPFRARGYLHQVENALFTEICYDLSSSENFRRLIKEGYLCKLYSKETDLIMDTKGVKITAGDFNAKALDKKLNKEEITEQALDEVIKTGNNYKKWLIFAISIEHAESIQEYLNEQNINSGIVHSKMEGDRGVSLDRFRSGFFRAMINVNVLTTGLDIPDIDLIVMLRPTKSPVIYAQSVGRGLRVHPDKDHCLVLDFAGNVSEHGPVDNILIQNKGKKRKGEAITKTCPIQSCKCINHAAARFCEACNFEFDFKVKIEAKSSNKSILKESEKGWIDVNLITINRHKKINKPDSIRIDYVCGLRRFSQWAAVQSNSGYAAHSAKHVISRFVDLPDDFEYTIENILDQRDNLRTPKRIYVDQSERYPTIDNIDFGE